MAQAICFISCYNGLMTHPSKNLKLAERGPIISIVTYLILAASKLTAGYWLTSSSLIADGFNNLSDILGNLAILIGLKMAQKPADGDHKFGHWKIEDLASLVTSFLMFVVGFQVLIQTARDIIVDNPVTADPLGSLVGLVSAAIMFALYRYNKHLSLTLKSGSLIAAAKDNLSDAVTSLGTSLAIVASTLKFPLLDKLVALVITLFILKTAYEIFSRATFSLSDGFDDKHLAQYEAAILELPKVLAVKSQRGRTYGSNVYLDIVLEMHPDLSVYESHEVTEQVEQLLRDQFGVYDIDIHVEPSPVPEDEVYENVYRKLVKLEKTVLSKIPDYENLLASEFRYIDKTGQTISATAFDRDKPSVGNDMTAIELVSISQKTKLLTYELDGCHHSSLWRRHETWQLIFHQVTEIPR